jgi:transposase-like protein
LARNLNYTGIAKRRYQSMLQHFKTLPQLLDYFKEEQTCKEYLAHHRWEGNVTCPFCSHQKVYITNRGYKCASKACYKKFSVTVGTIFENTKLPLRTWFAGIYLATSHKKGISSLQLGRDLGIDKKNAWFMLQRIREVFFPENMPKVQDGLFHVDETFIGGKNKNRHAHKKVDNSQGRSLKDKSAVFGIMQTGGEVFAVKVPNTQTATLKPIIEALVEKGAIIVSDEWHAYNTLGKDYNHVVLNHRQEEYVRGAFHNNGLEGFWSLFKRGYVGIYHYMSAKHLDRYCQEFSYRFNRRTKHDMERFSDAIKRTHGRRITWNQLTEKKDANGNVVTTA